MISEQHFDFIQPFQIEGTPVQGKIVRLGPALTTILKQHDYPLQVAHFLAELTTITAALSGGLKSEKGLVTSQVQGKGPLKLAVSDGTAEGHLRGYAQFQKEDPSLYEEDSINLKELLGEGFLTMTHDSGPYGERYQGVVALEGKSLTDSLHAYFRQSEQLAGVIKIAVQKTELGDWQSGLILLQKLPEEGEKSSLIHSQETEEAWETWYEALALLNSLSEQELLNHSLSSEDILYRLFHQRGVRVFPQRLLKAQCRCSETRAYTLIQSLSPEEQEEMSQEGILSVRCEFCNQEYHIPVPVAES